MCRLVTYGPPQSAWLYMTASVVSRGGMVCVATGILDGGLARIWLALFASSVVAPSATSALHSAARAKGIPGMKAVHRIWIGPHAYCESYRLPNEGWSTIDWG